MHDLQVKAFIHWTRRSVRLGAMFLCFCLGASLTLAEGDSPGLVTDSDASKAGTAEALLTFDDAPMRKRYYQLIDELRCPKCQNQNLADSNAPIAQDLKQQLQRLLREGKSDAQILSFMTSRYGTFVLYEPPRNSYTMVLWLLPLVVFIAGLLFLFSLVRKQTGESSGEAVNKANPQSQNQPKTERTTVDDELDSRLEQLRKRAES